MDGLQVIASPRRLRILELVWDRELSAGQIAAEFDVSWSAISQHITVLRTAGFVQERLKAAAEAEQQEKDRR
jgi:DNA-binding transcriptional ArsR family regulator